MLTILKAPRWTPRALQFPKSLVLKLFPVYSFLPTSKDTFSPPHSPQQKHLRIAPWEQLPHQHPEGAPVLESNWEHCQEDVIWAEAELGNRATLEKYSSAPILCTTWSCDEKFVFLVPSSYQLSPLQLPYSAPRSKLRLSLLQSEPRCLTWASLPKYFHATQSSKILRPLIFMIQSLCKTKRLHYLTLTN